MVFENHFPRTLKNCIPPDSNRTLIWHCLLELAYVSKIEIKSKEFSFLSRDLRVKIINFELASMAKIERNFLDLFWKPEIKCQKILVASQCARLHWRNCHSRLEVEKVTFVDLWWEHSYKMGWYYHFLSLISSCDQSCNSKIIFVISLQIYLGLWL